MDDAWGTIGQIVTWLDASSALSPEIEKLLRIGKVTEEAGEVQEAVSGTYGQNPRKGITHTWEDVQACFRRSRVRGDSCCDWPGVIAA